jgi:hypothetical protein
MTVGLASSLPSTLASGLQAHGVPAHAAASAAHLPPVSTLFAAFLGVNPIRHLLMPSTLSALPPSQQSALTGTHYFPQLISSPFHSGLTVVFTTATVMCVIAAIASLARGPRLRSTSPVEPAAVALAE